MSEAVREAPKKQRPQFRNIHVTDLGNYRMTLASTVSILHRISGFIMFAALPVILYMLQQSLLSEDTFKYFAGIMSHPLAKLVTTFAPVSATCSWTCTWASRRIRRASPQLRCSSSACC
jgi:succinate dehydrogenase cytochrome b556 subunit